MKYDKSTPFFRQALILFCSLVAFSLLNLFLMHSGIRERLDEADASLLLTINRHYSFFFGRLLDTIASTWLWLVIFLCLATLLYRHYGERATVLIVVALVLPVLLYGVTTVLVKPCFGRLSPALRLGDRLHLSDPRISDVYSFASARAAAVFALTIFLWLVLGIREQLLKWLLLAYALLVAFDRLYSGQHYPGDILGSLLLGAAAGFLTYLIYDALNEMPFV